MANQPRLLSGQIPLIQAKNVTVDVSGDLIQDDEAEIRRIMAEPSKTHTPPPAPDNHHRHRPLDPLRSGNDERPLRRVPADDILIAPLHIDGRLLLQSIPRKLRDGLVIAPSIG